MVDASEANEPINQTLQLNQRTKRSKQSDEPNTPIIIQNIIVTILFKKIKYKYVTTKHSRIYCEHKSTFAKLLKITKWTK